MRNLTPVNWLSMFLASLFVVFGALAVTSSSEDGLELTIEMAVSTSPAGQIFYDPTAQFSEASSIHLTLEPDGAYHTYIAKLPSLGAGSSIRIDPGSGPGRVAIRRVLLERAGGRVTYAGSSLSNLKLLNHLQLEAAGDELAMTAIGNDPSISLQVPAGLERSGIISLTTKFASPVALLALMILFFMHRSQISAISRRVWERYPVVIVPATFSILWGMATSLGLGCSSNACVSGRSLGYGSLLMVALLALGVVGAAIVNALGRKRKAGQRPALILWILVGQVGLMVYVYIRSFIVSFIPFPVSKIEIVLIAVAALIFVGIRTNTFASMFATPRALRYTLMQLATLAAISIWIADRELPRLVMLSSDPEIHAFFARQLERMGAIPRDLEGWGNGAFHYPAGSAVLAYVWTSLSGLDVRNALAALPLVQCALAALVIVEVISVRTRSVVARLLILVAVLGVTLAGFLFPLYEQYSHMEGVARQMSGGSFALFCVLLIGHRRIGIKSEWITAIIMAGTLFGLGALNPVNVMVPSALTAAFVISCAVTEQRITPFILVPPIAAVFILLDPYYASLVFGGEPVAAKVELASSLKSMSFDEVASAWGGAIRSPGEFVRLVATFPAANPLPSFIVLFTSIGAMVAAAATRYRPVIAESIFATSLIVILWLMASLFSVLRDDARFYLLSSYFEFSLVQHKALLLTLLSGLVVFVVHAKYRQTFRASVMAVAAVLLVAVVVRPVQPHRLEPRYSYCGSMGCAAASDLAVIQKFMEKIAVSNPSRQGRILVPNSVNQMGPEKWLFPVGGARLLAQESDIPLAFYYYQGDGDYTTENYESHVCKTLDKQWLRSQNIRYLFLPTDRASACVASMEALLLTERVVISSGNSYLLELR